MAGRRQRSVNVKAGDLLHVETPLGIVNIRGGLTDAKGRRVDSIETIPNAYAGEPPVGISGFANTRLIENADESETDNGPLAIFDDSEMFHLREAASDYLAGFTATDGADYAAALSVAEKLGLNVDNYPDPPADPVTEACKQGQHDRCTHAEDAAGRARGVRCACACHTREA